MSKKNITIIGGGAAGFFAAINIKQKNPDYHVQIFEKSKTLLGKVRISGGGRCNVTHACFTPEDLITRYPRGNKELLAPFKRFNSLQTIEWFEKRGILLKTESDGRMFPVTDDSETIAGCFIDEAHNRGIPVRRGAGMSSLEKSDDKWKLKMTDDSNVISDVVIMACGSSQQTWKILEELGHQIIHPVPSLFTFNTQDERLSGIPGVSVAEVEIKTNGLKSSGPLLVTHWGLSGPAILKLSAWGARKFSELEYRFDISVNFLPGNTAEQILQKLLGFKTSDSKKTIYAHSRFNIPQRLWEKLCDASGIQYKLTWADSSKQLLNKLALNLCESVFKINGKSTYKEEFVTAGGVSLKNIDFKTMESRITPGLFLAGEVLNIDGITGGYNFQAAWTEAWIISESV
ncbi:MAG: NAD(P)/FAD-dependent oxidoreductase [Bacteroidia bacterium]|nr:NAD(P)/FAD-dependent oxidoreductase [Bacteroidia bacterium]